MKLSKWGEKISVQVIGGIHSNPVEKVGIMMSSASKIWVGWFD